MSENAEQDTRPVVVGVGRNTHAAVAWGVSEAMRLGVALHLVHAIPATDDAEEHARLVGLGDYRLRVAAERAARWTFDRLPTTSTLVVGSPAAVLLEASQDASVVVVERPRTIEVGNRGDSGGPSVSASLALAGRTPVVVVPSGWSGSTLGGPRTLTVGRRERTGWTAFARGTLAVAPGPVMLVQDLDDEVGLEVAVLPQPTAPDAAVRPTRHLELVRGA